MSKYDDLVYAIDDARSQLEDFERSAVSQLRSTVKDLMDYLGWPKGEWDYDQSQEPKRSGDRLLSNGLIMTRDGWVACVIMTTEKVEVQFDVAVQRQPGHVWPARLLDVQAKDLLDPDEKEAFFGRAAEAIERKLRKLHGPPSTAG